MKEGAGQGDGRAPLRTNSRILFAAVAGTSIEYYDFFIYGTAAALVFGPLFFPSYSPAAQTLLAFVTFGIAFVARPVGAMIFGHFGDRVGRKATLVASLLLMGISTIGIGLLPTFAQAGWIAPALLGLLRFGQGVGLGGEWGGAALLAVENAPRGWATRFGAVPQLGSPIGFMLANGAFLLLGLVLTPAEFGDWGWRIPFLASAVLVVIGFWIRLRIAETPEFQAAMRRAPPPRVPLFSLLREHGALVLAGSAGVVSTFAAFYLSTAFALAEATGALGYDRIQFLAVQLGANLLFALAIVLGAWLSDRTSPRRVMAAAAVATGLTGLILIPGLAAGSLGLAALTLALVMFAMGFTSGPLGAWLSSLFPVAVRYSGVSLAFTLGGVLGGAVTPIAAQAMSVAGAGRHAGWLLVAAALITLVGVLAARPREHAPA